MVLATEVGRSRRQEAALEPEEKLGVPWRDRAPRRAVQRATAGLLCPPEKFVSVLRDEDTDMQAPRSPVSGSPHTNPACTWPSLLSLSSRNVLEGPRVALEWPHEVARQRFPKSPSSEGKGG